MKNMKFKGVFVGVLIILISLLFMHTAGAGVLLSYPKFHATSATGVPLAGGKLYTYIAGTSTPKATYSDYACTTPNANPVVLDSRGEATIYLNGLYKLVLKDSSGTTIWTMDRVGSDQGTSYAFYPDPTVEDQGATSDGASLYDIVSSLSKEKKATIIFSHNGLANTTTYTFSTSLDLSDYTNLVFKVENGALLSSPAAGVTVTIYSPKNITASPRQQIFGGSGTITFSTSDKGSVMWFGATGDGTTNDSFAFQSAITALRHAYVPAGTYLIDNTTIPSNTLIEGEDRDSTVIKLVSSASDEPIFEGSDTTNGNENITIRNLTIDGNRSNQTPSGDGNYMGIRMDGWEDSTLENILIKDCATDGVYITKDSTTESQNIHIKGVRVTNCRRNGITVISVDGLIVTDSEIDSITGTSPQAGIDIEPDGAFTCEYITIANCLIHDNAEIGISIYQNTIYDTVQFVTISGNHIYDNTTYGIWIKYIDRFVIADNVVEGNGDTGIHIEGASTEIVNEGVIKGNLIKDSTVAGINIIHAVKINVNGNTIIDSGNKGIVLSGDQSRYNNISANVVAGSGDDGIRITSGAYNIVTDNNIYLSATNGIYLYSSNYNVVANNHVFKNGQHGIKIYDSSHNVISGNLVMSNSQDANSTYSNICLSNDSDYNNIQGNMCRQGGEANKPAYGIIIGAATEDANVVTNNDLYDSGASGSLGDNGTGTVTAAGNRT